MSEEKNEAETPKSTVIVTTETGREIRFGADEFDAEDQLDVRDTSRKANSGIVGSFAAGRWRDVRLDGVTTDDDDAKRDLLLAKKALDRIWSNVNGQHQDFTVVAKIIDEVSDQIGWPE